MLQTQALVDASNKLASAVTALADSHGSGEAKAQADIDMVVASLNQTVDALTKLATPDPTPAP